jgi:sulfur-oxidizing protein SoxY
VYHMCLMGSDQNGDALQWCAEVCLIQEQGIKKYCNKSLRSLYNLYVLSAKRYMPSNRNHMKRRQFLASGAMVSALLSMRPGKLIAEWSTKSFQHSSIDESFMNALGTRDLVHSEAVTIVAPPVASDGATVPVEVYSALMCDQLFLFVEKNLTPLVFKCDLHGNAQPYFALNIKMKESSTLYAVVSKGGKYFMTSVQVEVLAQAC